MKKTKARGSRIILEGFAQKAEAKRIRREKQDRVDAQRRERDAERRAREALGKPPAAFPPVRHVTAPVHQTGRVRPFGGSPMVFAALCALAACSPTDRRL